MNDHVGNPLADIPAIGISYQFQADDFRQMVLQAHVRADCAAGELDRLIDKVARACERQRAKAHLPTAKNLLAEKRAGLKQETEICFGARTERDEHITRWLGSWQASGRRGEFKMQPKQQQEKNQLDQAVGKSEQNIVVLQKEIRDLERRVADFEAMVGSE